MGLPKVIVLLFVRHRLEVSIGLIILCVLAYVRWDSLEDWLVPSALIHASLVAGIVSFSLIAVGSGWRKYLAKQRKVEWKKRQKRRRFAREIQRAHEAICASLNYALITDPEERDRVIKYAGISFEREFAERMHIQAAFEQVLARADHKAVNMANDLIHKLKREYPEEDIPAPATISQKSLEEWKNFLNRIRIKGANLQ